MPLSLPLQALVRMRLWSDVPGDKFASGLEVELPLPGYVTRVHSDVDPPGNASLQGWDFNEKSRLLRLRFKKIAGEATGAAALGMYMFSLLW